MERAARAGREAETRKEQQEISAPKDPLHRGGERFLLRERAAEEHVEERHEDAEQVRGGD